MATVKCKNCGRALEIDEAGRSTASNSTGRFISEGTQWTDEDCGHCHFCLYDDCEVFLRHSYWLCDACCP